MSERFSKSIYLVLDGPGPTLKYDYTVSYTKENG